MLRHVAVVRNDVSEEPRTSIIKVTRISEVGETLAVITNRRTMRINTSTSFLQMSVLTRGTQCNLTEDGILHVIEYLQCLILRAVIWTKDSLIL
jgi:hypothetical protein